MCTGMFMAVLDIQVVASSFPNIGAALHISEDRLRKMLTFITLHPELGKVRTAVPELGINGEVEEDELRERVGAYARKLLKRIVKQETK